ncbi:hypothetical protein IJI31_04105 [bacterium]|nr:hypothetical protein [bacterium]
MSFEYFLLNDKKSKKLSDDEQNQVISKIVDDFLLYDKKRSDFLSKAKSLSDAVFFKNVSVPTGKDSWKAKVKMCKLFMFYQTLKAYIWKNVYSNVASMFDVSGENNISDNDSNKQKAALVDIFEKMDYQKTCDDIIDNALIFGELISFTAWKKKYQEYRRPIDFFKNLFSSDFKKLPDILNAISKGQNYWTDIRKIYDNPYIYSVNPQDLVFDISQKSDWDNCPKIYRSFKTPHDIINNKLYKINNETKTDIYNLLSSDYRNYNDDFGVTNHKAGDVVRGSTIEVLEHWGNFTLSDGTILNNWHAVIVGRKYLVKFSKNERIINPFTFGTLVEDPNIKRGISPLFSVLDLSKLQENLIDRTLNLQSLSENPPLIAPEGFFEDDEISLYPGKIIEYSDNLSPQNAFQQLQFNPSIFLNDISFLDDLMCQVSGVFPNMTGASDPASKTATEINVKMQGQITRLSMIIDTINQYLIIPNVRKVAELCANFKSGIELISINKDNKKEFIEIDDSVRQGDYNYTYSDRSAFENRSANADIILQAIDKFTNLLPLNLQEIFVWFFEQKGVDNPQRFLN